MAVFGLRGRQGKVYTVVVNDTKTSTLMPIISSKIKPDSIVYTDCYRSCDALDVSQFHHQRVNHSAEFAQGNHHVNGIENLWSQAISDGSQFSSGGAENPTLTIVSLALRQADYIARQMLARAL